MAAFTYLQAEEIRDALRSHGVRYLFIDKQGSRVASQAAGVSGLSAPAGPVTRDGFPVRHRVFPGNTVDVTTVEVAARRAGMAEQACGDTWRNTRDTT